jgi:hypothetical protein
MTVPRYYVGLDLGKAADYTALAVVEHRSTADTAFYDVRYLKRWPVGISYPAIARDVRRMIENDPLTGVAMACWLGESRSHSISTSSRGK